MCTGFITAGRRNRCNMTFVKSSSLLRFCARICLTACLLCACTDAASADVPTIQKPLDNGDDANRFVWVILAEGYTELEFDTFQDDASRIIDTFFSVSPFKEYASLNNVYTVFLASEESGADHPADGIYVDTALDASFGAMGIARLLTVDDAKAFSAASAVPQFDVVFALVNDEEYGGSGGSVIVVSAHESSPEIALHEAGHVIARLADEYETPYPGYPPGDHEPNVTFKTKRDTIPWKRWIDTNTPLPTPKTEFQSIGLFEGARYLSEEIFRPRHTCKMRQLNQPFCEICKEALVLNMYSLIKPIEQFSPKETALSLAPGTETVFSIDPVGGRTTGSYESMWEIDGEIVEPPDPFSLPLLPSRLAQGDHIITVWANDMTPLVKTDPENLLTGKQSWSVTKNFCSGTLTVTLVDGKTGNSVSGAAVALDPAAPAATEQHGAYVFADLPCGPYTITVSAEGFEPAQQTAGITDARESALELELEPGAASLYVSGSISGAAEKPVTIRLSGDQSASFTASGGIFSVGPLLAGTYTLTPAAPGYRFIPTSKSIELQNSSISDVVFSAMKKGLLFTIAGSVSGAGREDIIISVEGPSNATVLTDGQGAFILEDLPPGNYTLTPSLQGAAFEPPSRDVTIENQNASGLKFVKKESPCPATVLYSPQSRHAQTLRTFRDTALRKTPGGSSYVSRYYLVSPEVSRLLQKSSTLRSQARGVLDSCMPAIEEACKSGTLKLSPQMISDIRHFADHLSSHGSPLLQRVITHFLDDIEKGKL